MAADDDVAIEMDDLLSPQAFAELLGGLGNPNSRPSLQELLGGLAIGDPNSQPSLHELLGGLGDPNSQPSLHKLLEGLGGLNRMNDIGDELNLTLLHQACLMNNSDKVAKLLRDKAVDISATDENNSTPLHCACQVGHTEIVELLIQERANRLKFALHENDADSKIKSFFNLTDNHKNIPLGLACIEGHTEIVELLLEQEGVDINHINSQKRTPLAMACIRGHTKIVELLLKKGANANVTDENELTPLGNASIPGHTEIVKLLLEHGANVNVTDNYGNTPLSSACNTGHTEIVKLLLKQDVDEKINALDVAVVLGRRDAAMAIVKSDKWEDALCSYEVGDANVLDTIVVDKSVGDTSAGDTSGDDRIFSKLLKFCKNKRKDAITTPMRRVIEKMPDVAKVVFDRCCETKGSPYDNDYEITYNYEFLEDFDLDDRQTQPSHLKSDNNDCKRSKWPPQSRYSSQNHCLNILANSPSADLLKHPLAATLLDQKWNKYGRIVYYTNLIFYFLFVILLTSFALTVHPPNSSKCMEILGNDTDTFIDCFSEGRSAYVSIASVFVIVYSIIMLIRELAQVIQFKLEYLSSFVNYIEVPLFILTIMFTSVRSNQCYCTHSWQWQVGVIAVFLSWIALVFSIRKLPVVGIYVVMFIKIFNNFIKVVVLALLLISAFAFPLYMMFYNPQDRTEGIRTPFITPWRTIIKTITMTMGEYDMDSLLRQDDQRNAPDVQYPVVTFSLIIVFVVLMPILFLNLLIGLAVGDIEEIRKSADAYRRTLRVEFTLPIEEFLRTIANAKRLPKKVKSWIMGLVTVGQQYIVKPNQEKKCWESAISKIQKYFTTEPEESVYEVKNKSKPLSEEIKNLHSSVARQVKDLHSSVSEEVKDLHSSVSKEVKDLRSSVAQQVKDLQSSMDRLLAIVNSIKNERRGGDGSI